MSRPYAVKRKQKVVKKRNVKVAGKCKNTLYMQLGDLF